MKYQDPGSMPGCTAAVLRWYAIGVGTQGIAFALGSRMPALGGLALTPLGAFVSMLADILSNVSGHAGSTRSSGQYMDLDPLGWAVFDLIKRRARAALAQAMIVHDFSTRCRRRRSRGCGATAPRERHTRSLAGSGARCRVSTETVIVRRLPSTVRLHWPGR